MSEKRTYKLISDQVRAHCIDEIARAPLGKVVIVQDPTRTLEANARLHAMLTDIARQAQRMTDMFAHEPRDAYEMTAQQADLLEGAK